MNLSNAPLDPIKDLPTELSYTIAWNLETRDRAICRQVSKTWLALFNDNNLWHAQWVSLHQAIGCRACNLSSAANTCPFAPNKETNYQIEFFKIINAKFNLLASCVALDNSNGKLADQLARAFDTAHGLPLVTWLKVAHSALCINAVANFQLDSIVKLILQSCERYPIREQSIEVLKEHEWQLSPHFSLDAIHNICITLMDPYSGFGTVDGGLCYLAAFCRQEAARGSPFNIYSSYWSVLAKKSASDGNLVLDTAHQLASRLAQAGQLNDLEALLNEMEPQARGVVLQALIADQSKEADGLDASLKLVNGKLDIYRSWLAPIKGDSELEPPPSKKRRLGN